jgi:hypothetical protein
MLFILLAEGAREMPALELQYANNATFKGLVFILAASLRISPIFLMGGFGAWW